MASQTLEIQRCCLFFLLVSAGTSIETVLQGWCLAIWWQWIVNSQESLCWRFWHLWSTLDPNNVGGQVCSRRIYGNNSSRKIIGRRADFNSLKAGNHLYFISSSVFQSMIGMNENPQFGRNLEVFWSSLPLDPWITCRSALRGGPQPLLECLQGWGAHCGFSNQLWLLGTLWHFHPLVLVLFLKFLSHLLTLDYLKTSTMSSETSHLQASHP